MIKISSNSTLARIDKDLYHQLQEFSLRKNRNARCAKTELEKAVKEYLAKQQDQEKELKPRKKPEAKNK